MCLMIARSHLCVGTFCVLISNCGDLISLSLDWRERCEYLWWPEASHQPREVPTFSHFPRKILLPVNLISCRDF